MRAIQDAISSHSLFDAEIWGGETAAANQGGREGVTDTFVDSFWFLDQVILD